MTDAPPLALPAGTSVERHHVLNLGVLLLGGSTVMVNLALAGAYINLRALAAEWPPGAIRLDNYHGTTVFLTLLLSSVMAEWGVYSIRRNNTRQATAAFITTIGLGAAALNLIWYLGTQLGFGPRDHAYGTTFYAFLIVNGVAVAIAVVVALVALLRLLGGQVTARSPELARAACWYWQAVVLSWTVAYVTLYFFQNR
jgi:heme/copper-type cytochrome/quinol oxidase subunit 3